MLLACQGIVGREVGIQLRVGKRMQLRVVVVVHGRFLNPQALQCEKCLTRK